MIQIFFTILEAVLMFATVICFFARNDAFFLFMIFTFAMMVSKKIMIKVEEEFNKNNTSQDIDNNDDVKPIEIPNTPYTLKPFMNAYELDFYYKLQFFSKDYIVVPKINLGTIVNHNCPYNIDFAIFTKDFRLLVLIELSDKNDKQDNLLIQKVLKDTNIKLVKFYTSYPNDIDYIIKRVTASLS